MTFLASPASAQESLRGKTAHSQSQTANLTLSKAYWQPHFSIFSASPSIKNSIRTQPWQLPALRMTDAWFSVYACRRTSQAWICYHESLSWAQVHSCLSPTRKIAYRCCGYRKTKCKAKLEYSGSAFTYRTVNRHSYIPNAISRRRWSTSPPRWNCYRQSCDCRPFYTCKVNLGANPVAIWRKWKWSRGERDDGTASDQSRLHSAKTTLRWQSPWSNWSTTTLLGRQRSYQFFQFHYISSNQNPTRKLNRLIGWAYPVLINLLRYGDVTLFLDGTFRSVPRQFKQCVIFMVHGRASGLYGPVFYVLFELGIIQAVQTQFLTQNRSVVCSIFLTGNPQTHQETSHSWPRGIHCDAKEVLDMLTVLEPEHVNPRGIALVKQEIERLCELNGIVYSNAKWAKFFKRTWLERYSPHNKNVWSIQLARCQN